MCYFACKVVNLLLVKWVVSGASPLQLLTLQAINVPTLLAIMPHFCCQISRLVQPNPQCFSTNLVKFTALSLLGFILQPRSSRASNSPKFVWRDENRATLGTSPSTSLCSRPSFCAYTQNYEHSFLMFSVLCVWGGGSPLPDPPPSCCPNVLLSSQTWESAGGKPPVPPSRQSTREGFVPHPSLAPVCDQLPVLTEP